MEKTFGMFERKVLIFFQENKYSIVLDAIRGDDLHTFA
jgi:hypothetical protein